MWNMEIIVNGLSCQMKFIRLFEREGKLVHIQLLSMLYDVEKLL